jgi:hypothetical protein
MGTDFGTKQPFRFGLSDQGNEAKLGVSKAIPPLATNFIFLISNDLRFISWRDLQPIPFFRDRLAKPKTG